MKYTVKEMIDLAHQHGLKGVNRLPKEKLARLLIEKEVITDQSRPLLREVKIKDKYIILWFPKKTVMYSFTSFYKGEQYTGIEREMVKYMAERYDPLQCGDHDHIEPYKKAYASYPHENEFGNMAFKWFWWFPFSRARKGPKTGQIFQLSDSCIAFLRDKRNNVSYIWRTSEQGDLMSYIAGGVKLQMEFTFTLSNDELTASGKNEDTVILESRFFSPHNKLGKGCLRFREMLFNVCHRYREFVLKEDLKGKNYKVSYKYRLLPEKDINEAAQDIQTYNKTMKHRFRSH